MYGDTRIVIGARWKPSSTSAMNSADAIPRSVSSSFSGRVIECLLCQRWSRKVASSTSLYAGIARQKSPPRSWRWTSVDGSTGGFFARGGADGTIGSEDSMAVGCTPTPAATPAAPPRARRLTAISMHSRGSARAAPAGADASPRWRLRGPPPILGRACRRPQ